MEWTEPVEIKATVAGAVPAGLDALGIAGGSRRDIWFLEDLTPGLPSVTPMLAAGIIFRLRADDDSDDDSTVKLRPCRRSQLAPGWTSKREDDDGEYRVEADWCGQRRVLAASYVVSLEPGRLVEAVSAPGADLSKVFCRRQQDFLADCADLRIALTGLTPLGPVAATRWKNLDLGDFEVDAERWVVGDLDFLELSIRVRPGEGDPVERQAAFEELIRSRGLAVADVPATKTAQVLEQLVKDKAGS